MRRLTIELLKANLFVNLKKLNTTIPFNIENKITSINKYELLLELLIIIIIEIIITLKIKVIFSFKELLGSCATNCFV